MEYQPLHPVEGSLMLYYDQLNTISKHLQREPQMQTNAKINAVTDPHTHNEELGQSFKLHQRKKRDNWPEWQQARYKMLNSYHDQEMFSAPMEKPHGANTHHMLWRYTIKMCSTKKARMVCDRSSHQGTIMLGHL